MALSIQVRSAIPDDWRTIAEFNIRLAEETENKQLVPETIEAGVQRLLSDATLGRYFVACLDSQIIGQMMHTREWSDWRNGEIWWLQSIYIHRDYRNAGVFRTLYRHLENLAKQSPSVVGLRLYVEEHNARAIDAYRKMGMLDAGYKVMERIRD